MTTARITSMITTKTPNTAPAAGPAMLGDVSTGSAVSREIACQKERIVVTENELEL